VLDQACIHESALLEMRGMTKEFSGVRVLDDVDFELKRGEVHALLGANGAGKSTLMKILNGIYTSYSGEIFLNGNRVTFGNPREAYESGIGMIHQELDLVGCRDVSENIFLGRELYGFSPLQVLDRKEMRVRTQKLLNELGFDISANITVEKLPPAKQQLVLIARVLSLGVQLIIMDEPTSSLSIRETDVLFDVISNLKKQGIGIIYISHYLEEVFRVADRLTVLRDGKRIITEDVVNCTHDQLVQWMIGHSTDSGQRFEHHSVKDETVLSVSDYSMKRDHVADVSFTLKRGEILGIAGVVGSGRTELVEMIIGAEPKRSGFLTLEGKNISIDSPVRAVECGIAIVPEDRKSSGLVMVRSIWQNMALSSLARFATFRGLLNFRAIYEEVERMIGYLTVRCNSQNQEISQLSGGNQQKAVLGKCLMHNPKVLILDQPTRGVDVGAKDEIYSLVYEQSKRGTSVIYVSDELEEILALSDRILVMKQGRIVREYQNGKKSLTKTELLAAMIH
jgi:ABC-type sugar transport system ATPase subunit